MTTQALQEKLQRYLSYIAQDETNINLLLSTSECYRQLNDLDSAQRYLDSAKQLAGSPFWTQQGLVHLSDSNLPLAKEAFIKALAELDTPLHRYNLSLVLYLTREFEAALTLLNSGETTELSYASEFLKAKLMHHLDYTDEAIMVLENLISPELIDPEVTGLLALLYFDHDDEDKAVWAVQQTLAKNPNSPEGRLVQVLLQALHNEAAVADIEALLESYPDDYRLWYALGTTHMQQMNITAAKEAFIQTADIWPEFYDNWFSLAWCFLLQDQLDHAKEAYEHAIAIDAESADGFGGLALVYALRHQDEAANKALETAEHLDPNCFLATLARMILANSYDSTEASESFKTAFPEVQTEMNHMLAQALLTLHADESTLH